MTRRLILVVALCLAVAPVAARADVLHAETILPPGQSGFVSIPGLADGSGSPHLYDQLADFIAFRWKPAGFNEPGVVEAPKPGVAIVRDSYGVPAITGATEEDMWWGAGYAAAQDRLFELELFR
ncbi:MAG: penicillin amidase, partial [Solirubrobacteraceae bacterium]|nr:penicillin amidase [Solirubrobacteraceae bacterium]